ncbi:MAG: SRPBCC domain-containing protein [Alphaproteobacteria bacterium]
MTDIKINTQGMVLELQRTIDAPRYTVWRCWTEPDLLKKWYCPKPWMVTEAEVDLTPGGIMRTVMQGPDGTQIDVDGIFLEVVDGERLTFTDGYGKGFVPRETSFMTGYVVLADAPGGKTTLTWGARHTTEDDKQKHLEMGFEPGWSAASEQLNDLAKTIADDPSSCAGLKKKVRTCLFLRGQDVEDAAEFYALCLPDSRIESTFRPDPKGPPMVIEMTLAGAPYMILGGNPAPAPSHMMSVSVLTKDQDETDALWETLTADGGEPGQCGWLKDRFGVHWQIVPEALPRLMNSGDPDAAARVTGALMDMSKIEIDVLETAHKAA